MERRQSCTEESEIKREGTVYKLDKEMKAYDKPEDMKSKSLGKIKLCHCHAISNLHKKKGGN